MEFHGESECKRQRECTVLGRVGLPRIPGQPELHSQSMTYKEEKLNFQIDYTLKQ